MEDMVYTSFCMRRVIASGEEAGYSWYVLSLGTHPTAYVKLPKGTEAFSVDDISCHGGITYVNSSLKIGGGMVVNGFWIGWDYAHSGDFSGYFPGSGGKEWTTEEIIDDVKDVISQLIVRYGRFEPEPEEIIELPFEPEPEEAENEASAE